MLHTCYHILSNHSDEYVRSLEEVQSRIDELETNEENNIEVSQIFTEEEFDVDAICLKEVQVSLGDMYASQTSAAAELV